jgi:hypothetical protein
LQNPQPLTNAAFLPTTTGRTLTRVDRDGVPSIVQSIVFDPSTGLYRAVYFDGTYTTLRGSIRVNIVGTLKAEPPPQEWERVEREAVDKYANMMDIKRSLVFDYKP